MAVKRFEDLIAWQKAQELAVVIYKQFDSSKDFSFKNQICSAAVSISSNVAEGFESGSNANFVRYLRIARSSCNEVKSLIYLAHKLNFINEKTRDGLIASNEEVSKIVFGLIKSMSR